VRCRGYKDFAPTELFFKASAKLRDGFTQPHCETLNRNLRNPPPQSLRRDRFCVICGYLIRLNGAEVEELGAFGDLVSDVH